MAECDPNRARVLGGGVRGSLRAAGEAVAKAPGLAAGVDDVRAVRESVDDGLRQAGRRGRPWSIRRTAGWW